MPKIGKAKAVLKGGRLFYYPKKEEIMLTQYKIYCLLARPPPYKAQIVYKFM